MTLKHRWLQRWSDARMSWGVALDFMDAGARTSPGSWLALVTGVMAVMMSLDVTDRVQRELEDGRSQLKRLSLAERQARLARAAQRDTIAPGKNAGDSPPLQGDRLVDALGMARLLAYPWREALNQVNSHATQHQAALLAMSVDLDKPGQPDEWTPVWRLQAVVRDEPSALAWAGPLPGGQILSQDRLPQPLSGASGLYELKVDALMRWRAAPRETLGASKRVSRGERS